MGTFKLPTEAFLKVPFVPNSKWERDKLLDKLYTSSLFYEYMCPAHVCQCFCVVERVTLQVFLWMMVAKLES